MQERVLNTQGTTSHTEACLGYEDVLRKAGLRSTKQRMLLMGLLFGEGAENFRHVTAEMLFKEAQAVNVQRCVSLATVYNNLNRFAEAGLIRRLMIDEKVVYFDTDPGPHYHMYCPEDGTLINFKTNMSFIGEDTSLSLPVGYTNVECSLLITLRKTGN